MRAATQAYYDRLSRWYDLLSGRHEDQARARGMSLLDVLSGEHALEVGCGTGRILVELARAVGPTGRAWGVDLSTGMCRIAADRLANQSSHASGWHVLAGDALHLPFRADCLDAVIMCFTLELFDTDDISLVLGEIHRIVRPAGRLCVVSMADCASRNLATQLYVWAHERFPVAVDCRPIPVPAMLADAGWAVRKVERLSIWGLPVEAALAVWP